MCVSVCVCVCWSLCVFVFIKQLTTGTIVKTWDLAFDTLPKPSDQDKGKLVFEAHFTLKAKDFQFSALSNPINRTISDLKQELQTAEANNKIIDEMK